MPTSRYGTATAACYDLVSGERPVYRAGRVAAVAALRLSRGAVVLDLGCGTGLDLPLLLDAVGPTGSVVALDASAPMLARAARRGVRLSAALGGPGVHLVRADAAAVDPHRLRPAGRPLDAVIACYALSLVPAWQDAWRTAAAAARPGARMAVVDMALPTGAARPLAPLARAACRLGGSDIGAHPWTALERDCTDVTSASLRGGHVQVRVGTLR